MKRATWVSLRFNYILLTSTLIVHAGLVVGTSIITATSDVTQPILTDLISHAMIVAVANGFANSSVATFVA